MALRGFHKTSPLLSNFMSQRWADKFQLVIAKKEVEYDYVGIDVSALVGLGLRLAKNVVTEQRRNREVARHVTSQVHQILKRFHPTKGLGLFLDGSEGLYKARSNRSSTMTRKLESRLQRLPATALMQAVEDRVVRMMPENRLFPSEVLLSGTCVAGPVEQKFSAWALDVASRDISDSSTGAACTSSLCLVGGSELYLNALALTPFFTISNLVQQNSDFRQMRLQDSLEWLTLDGVVKAGHTACISSMRTDILFLHLMCSGCSATDLAALPNLTFTDVLKAYLSFVEKNHYKLFLFDEVAVSQLTLHLDRLLEVLRSATQRSKNATSAPRACPLSSSYLQFVLFSHRMLTHGHVVDPMILPHATTPLVPAFIAHLHHLTELNPSLATTSALSSASDDPLPPLTAGEFTMLSYSQTNSVESSILGYVGVPSKPEVGRSISSEANIENALKKIRTTLSFVNPAKPPKTLCHSSSYAWVQNPKSKLWTFQYVDAGERALRLDARRVKSLASGGVAMDFSGATDGPCVYDSEKSVWSPVSAFPVGPKPEQQTTIKFLSWNVMFDRYSGKPTPLGMPGIDWCSPQRYPVLSKVMERSDADVIGMQEVEPAFWAFLADQPWVKANYMFSCNKSGPAINPWGVLMMVHKRLVVDQLTHHNVPAWAGHVSLLPVLTIKVNGKPLHVAAIHLIAPFTKGRESARTGQDSALRQRLTKSISGDCVTMGDFNDWPTNEFIMPTDSGYTEAWPIVCPGDPGKTMDETNTFCRLKIEEIFFGRSDKVFYRGQRLKPLAAKMVGTKSVNEENGNTAAPAYLFPSDHYGVETTFSVVA